MQRLKMVNGNIYLRIFQNFRGGGLNPSSSSPNFVLQSFDLFRPKNFPTVLEWPRSVKAFSSYASAKKKWVCRSVNGSAGTYKLELLQALSLITAFQLYHRRVNRAQPDMLSTNIFISRQPFGSCGPKYAPMAARQSQ